MLTSATGVFRSLASRDSLCQSFGANMRVVSAHRLGVVSNQLHDDSFRDTGILQ
jgi:hypothetical protein